MADLHLVREGRCLVALLCSRLLANTTVKGFS